MAGHGVLDDGKPQSGAPGLLGVALVHPVEPLENPGLVLCRDADAGVFHPHHLASRLHPQEYLHGAPGLIVLDGVFREIVEDFIQKPPHSQHGKAGAGELQCHLLFLRHRGKRLENLLGNRADLHRLLGKLHPLVQLGQADNVLHQIHKPGGLLTDMPQKPGLILRLYQAAFQKLCTADDGLQGGFQLVGHIGGEFPPVLLGLGLLRHVQRQNDRTHDFPLGLNPAQLKQVLPAVALGVDLAAPLAVYRIHGLPQLLLPVHREKVPAHTALIHPEKGLGGGVDAQHHRVLVQKHQTLFHVPGNLLQFLGLLLEICHLPGNLPVLLSDAVKQRRNLLVNLVIQRILQIHLIQRLYNPPCHPPGKDGGKKDCQKHQPHHRQHHIHRQRQGGHAADGNPQHRAVCQPHRLIDGLFHPGVGVADAAAGAGGQSLLHLLPGGVVIKLFRILPGIVEHLSLGVNPGEAELRFPYPQKIVLAAFLGAGRRQVQVIGEPLLPAAVQIPVGHKEKHQKAAQQHHGGGGKNRPKDFTGHDISHR